MFDFRNRRFFQSSLGEHQLTNFCEPTIGFMLCLQYLIGHGEILIDRGGWFFSIGGVTILGHILHGSVHQLHVSGELQVHRRTAAVKRFFPFQTREQVVSRTSETRGGELLVTMLTRPRSRSRLAPSDRELLSPIPRHAWPSAEPGRYRGRSEVGSREARN